MMVSGSMTARQCGLLPCHACGLLSRVATASHSMVWSCTRCGTRLHSRKPHSLARCTIYSVAAAALMVPANLLPVMTVETMGQKEPQTIISGIAHLYYDGQPLLSAIVLVASLLIPLVKLLGLALLLVSVRWNWQWSPVARTRLYRGIELIGRWSMLDVFVVALLVALVRFGSLASIRPGAGATAFAAVVILTMLATLAFDPRLVWDRFERSELQ